MMGCSRFLGPILPTARLSKDSVLKFTSLDNVDNPEAFRSLAKDPPCIYHNEFLVMKLVLPLKKTSTAACWKV